jgi:hypothetical protein
MLYILQHFKPAAAWHIDVQQQHVGLRIDQLGKYLISIGSFGKMSARERIEQYLPQPAPNVRMVVRYQNIHRLIRSSGCIFDL